jgi:predicted enzyme related to lactoylglutathione lyase
MATTNTRTTGSTTKTQAANRSTGNKNATIRERPPARPNTITHSEFASRDPQATREFLSEVFGWEFETESTPSGDYHMTRFNETNTGGGVRGLNKAEAPTSIPYVEVEDLTETERIVKQKGGKILQPRTAMGDNGELLVLQAPGGPIIGLWAPTT